MHPSSTKAKLIRLALAALVATLACSCASSRRAMRISPFSESATPVGSMDEQRVNLWPLAYHQPGATSILWPFVDLDDQGFAIRPLFNQEGDDYSILFPLCAWNPVDGDGWLLTGYWDRRSFGLAPLFHRGPRFNHLGPAWWLRRPRGNAYGLFPLAAKNDEFLHLGLFWKDGQWNKPGAKAGLFPLAAWERDRHHWLFPLYSHRQRGPEKSRLTLGLGVLAYFDHAAETDTTRWLAPAYFDRRQDDEHLQLLLPLWYSHQQGDQHTDLLLPAFLHQRDEHRRLLLTPLGGRAWATDGTTTMRNLLGPLYHWHQTDSTTFNAFLWPLITTTRDRQNDDYRLVSWPLGTCWIDEGQEHTRMALFGACYDHATPKLHNRSLLWGTQRWHRQDGQTSWHAWPLASVQRHPRDTFDDPLFRASLVNRHNAGNQHSLTITPLFGYSALDNWREWYALPLAAGAAGEALRAGEVGLDALAFYARRQDPDQRHLRLGWGLLGSSTTIQTPTRDARRLSILLLARQAADDYSREAALDHLASHAGRPWTTTQLASRSFTLFPLLWQRREMAIATDFGAPARQRLIQEWRRRVDQPTPADPNYLASLESRLLANLKTDPESARQLATLNPETPRQHVVDTLRETIAASARRHVVEWPTAKLAVPLLYNSERQRQSSHRHLLLLWRRNDRTSQPEELIANWAAGPWGTYLGETTTCRRQFFPLLFRRAATGLKLVDLPETLLATAREWVRLDQGGRAWSHLPAARTPQTTQALEAAGQRLAEALADQPQTAELAQQAQTASHPDEQAVILYQALETLAAANTAETYHASTRIPILFNAKTDDHNRQWKLLFGAVSHHQQGENRRFSILRYLYRREQTEQRIYRDFVPFCTWNSAPEQSDFAFLWRLFHLRRQADQRSGHLLFIPFGQPAAQQ